MATNDSIRLSSDTSKAPSDKGKRYTEKGPAMGYARETREWFAQKYYTRPPLNIAFESAQLTYSDLPVDLYNTGVNQILSVAAGRGHQLFHFSMKELFWDGNLPAALMSVLALDPSWSRENQGSLLEAHRHLRVVDRRVVPLKSIQLFVVRGDDIRTEQSENLSVLRWASENMKMIESVEATLATTDKYGTIRRAPQLPHPVTFAADNLENALDAIRRLPRADGSFVLKDRYGYGCGAQVHRLRFDAPGLEQRLSEYIETYGNILLQEYCPEIEHGDIVVTFFDDELIGALRRLPEPGQWKTNASLGAREVGCNLTARQESIARALKRSFPECRLVSVDLLESGKILEINAFPGGRGLLKNYGIALGEIVMDRLERELMGKGAELSAPSALSWSGAEKSFPTGTHWPDIEALYSVQQGTREVFDVLSGDRYHLDIRDLIRFEARSPEYILSIPHAGVFVPESHRNRFRLNEKSLIEIDLYSDLLYETSEGLQVHSELETFSSTLEQQIRPHGLGLSVARDVPYAGGFITRKHHNPRKHVHVIQIEVSMDTYMYEAIVDEFKRYALKKPRLRIVRNAVRNAFRAACEAAECIYRKEETSSDANA